MKKLALIALLGALVFNAQALSITPATGVLNSTRWVGDDNSNLNPAQIAAIVGEASLTLVYNAEVPKEVGDPVVEGGSFAGSYTTTFDNEPNDPSEGLIDYIGGSSISGGSIYLYVKDGNHSPAFYIFDISGWNGTDDIVLDDFWPQSGAISHVSILTTPGTNVPDGGATIALLGLAFCGVALGFRGAKN